MSSQLVDRSLFLVFVRNRFRAATCCCTSFFLVGWPLAVCFSPCWLKGITRRTQHCQKRCQQINYFLFFSEGGANWCFLQLEPYEAQASNQWDEWHSERCGHFQVQCSSPWETCRSLFVICIHGSLQGRVEGWNKSGVAIVSSILANTHRPHPMKHCFAKNWLTPKQCCCSVQRENRCESTICLLCCCWWTKLVNVTSTIVKGGPPPNFFFLGGGSALQ